MEILLNIHYFTEFLCWLSVRHGKSSNITGVTANEINLQYIGGGHWTCPMTIEDPNQLLYQYFLSFANTFRKSDEIIRKLPNIVASLNLQKLLIKDEWTVEKNSPYFHLFSTKTFKNLLTFHKKEDLREKIRNQEKKIVIIFQIKNEQIRRREKIYVTGNCPELGNWDAEKACELHVNGEISEFYQSTVWSAAVTISNYHSGINYKYLTKRTSSEYFQDLPEYSNTIHWESGENRYVHLDLLQNLDSVLLFDDYFRVLLFLHFFCLLFYQ